MRRRSRRVAGRRRRHAMARRPDRLGNPHRANKAMAVVPPRKRGLAARARRTIGGRRPVGRSRFRRIGGRRRWRSVAGRRRRSVVGWRRRPVARRRGWRGRRTIAIGLRRSRQGHRCQNDSHGCRSHHASHDHCSSFPELRRTTRSHARPRLTSGPEKRVWQAGLASGRPATFSRRMRHRNNGLRRNRG